VDRRRQTRKISCIHNRRIYYISSWSRINKDRDTEQRPELAFYEFNNDGLVDVVKLDTEDNDTYLPVNFYGAMAWVADWHEKEFPSLLGNYNADTDCVPCIINAWSDEYALSIAIQLGVEGGIKLFSERYIESPLEENCDQSAVASSVFKQEHDEEGNRVVIYYDRGEF